MITLERGVYFIDAMQKLSEKIHGGVIGTYAVVTKIWMPKWCSLKRERHPGSCGLTKNGLYCKIKKNENKMVYYEKKPQNGFYAKRIALANGRLYDTKK